MTLCIAIDRELTVRKCPLDRGTCYWQHRESHECCYTEVEMTTQEFCQHVGIKGQPSEEQVGKFMVKLRAML